MSTPPRQIQPPNHNVPEDFMDDLLGHGFSYSDWEIRFRQRNYFWSEGMKNKMIDKEREYFKTEIIRLTAEENKAGKLKCKTNSLASILKRLQGEWLKGTLDEKEERRSTRRLMGKDAKPRCLQSHVKRWKEAAASDELLRVSAKGRTAVGVDPPPLASIPNRNDSLLYDSPRPATAYGYKPTSPSLETTTPDSFNRVGMFLNIDRSYGYPHYHSPGKTSGSSNQIARPVFDSELPAFVNQGMFADGPTRKLSNTPIYDNMMSSQNFQGSSSNTLPRNRQASEDPDSFLANPNLGSNQDTVQTEIPWGDWTNIDNEVCSSNQDIQSDPTPFHGPVQSNGPQSTGRAPPRSERPQDSPPDDQLVRRMSDIEMPDCDDVSLSDDAGLRGNIRIDRARRRNPNNDQQLRNRNLVRSKQSEVAKLIKDLAVKEDELKRRLEQIQQLEDERNAALQEKETAKIGEAESRKAKEIAEMRFLELEEQIKSSQKAVKRISRQLDDTVMADNLQQLQGIVISSANTRYKAPNEDNDSSQARLSYNSARSPGALTLNVPSGSSSASRSPSPGNNNLAIRPPTSRDRSHSGCSSSGLSARSTLNVQDMSSKDGNPSRGTSSSGNSVNSSFKQLTRKISDKFMGKTYQEHKKETPPPMPVPRPSTAAPFSEMGHQQRIPVSRQLAEVQNLDSGYFSQASPRASVTDKE